MTRWRAEALTRADIRKIEEALNTNDLEVMVATIDRIVALQIKKLRRDTSQPATVKLNHLDDTTWDATVAKTVTSQRRTS